MKTIKKIWGIGIIVIMLVTLLASAVPASAGTIAFGADTSVPSITDRILVGTPGSDILDFAVNGNTVYAVTGTADAKIYKSTNSGASWTALTAPAAVTGGINLIAVSPDDANVIVFLGNIGLAVATNLTAYVSTNGGSTFSALGTIQNAAAVAATACYDIDISALSSGTRYVGVAGTVAANTPGLYYFNLGAAAPVWKNAVTDFTTILVVGGIDSFRAVHFSPNFPSDQVITGVSEDIAANVRFHMASINSQKWDNVAGLGAYPVIVTATTAGVTSASIDLDPSYLGGDDTTRISMIGLTTAGAAIESGIYRLKDTSVYSLKNTTPIRSVAWDGTNLVAGAYTTNIVYRSADALASSPTVSSSTSYKRIGLDITGVNEMVLVAFSGTNVFAADSGSQSSFGVSADLGKTFNELSLIDTRISVMEDIYSSADNSKQYLMSRDTYLTGTIAVADAIGTRIVGALITFGPGSVTAGGCTLGGAGVANGTDLTGSSYTVAGADTLGVGTTFNMSVIGAAVAGGAWTIGVSMPGALVTFGVGSVDTAGTSILGGVATAGAGANLAGLSYTVNALDTLTATATVNIPGPGLSMFRKDTGTWKRVTVVAADGGYVVRGSPDNADVVYFAKKGTTTMFYTLDAGQTRWFTRASRYNIQDIAVESKDVAYVAVSGSASISKTTNAGFTWNTSVNTEVSGGNINVIHSQAVDKLLIGSTTGYVAYSTDGGTTWVKITKQLQAGALLTQVDASGLADKDYIYAGSSFSANIYRWQIGVDTSWTDMVSPVPGTPAGLVGATVTGLVLQGSVLYATVSTATDSGLLRTLGPSASSVTWSTFLTGVLPTIPSAVAAFNTAPSALKVSTASTTDNILYFINTVGNDTLWSYLDTLANIGPTLVAPVNNFVNPVNAITGRATDIGFSWSKPSKNVTDYDLEVYLDAAATNRLARINSAAATGDTVVIVAGPFQAAPNTVEYGPGNTYYWRVRVSPRVAGGPIYSQWSEIRSFTVEPGPAEVPAILSPSNGADSSATRPSFSWSPVARASEYQFVLALNPYLTAPIIDVKIATTAYRPLAELETGTTYYWAVKATKPVAGSFSAVANFTVAMPAAAAAPPVIITQVPAPTIIIPPQPTPPPAQTIIIPPAPQPPAPIAPAYIWAIIIIGAVLVIAVIVLIVRTRRTV